MRIYCEHSAVTSEFRAFSRDGRIELVYFPYDPGSQTRRISPSCDVGRLQGLYVDSAYKSGCAAIVTVDTDIDHKAELEALLRLRVFHPVIDGKELYRVIEPSAGGVNGPFQRTAAAERWR